MVRSSPTGDDVSDCLASNGRPHEPSRVLQSVILLNQAENYDDFREALRYWDIPAQNVVYADVEGNIAYQLPGLTPIRGKMAMAWFPSPAGRANMNGKAGFLMKNSPILNPEWGYIVTANHAVVDEAYPYFITLYWADGDRAQRITDLIAAGIDGDGKITVADIGRMQFDSHAYLADSYIPLLQGISSNDDEVQAALERLRGWDRQLRRDSVPAGLFEIFMMQLAEVTLTDNVGAANIDDFDSNVLFHALAADPQAVWWDDLDTDATETQKDMLLRALTGTIAWFAENQGGDMNDWTWGSIHTATFPSNPLGQSGIGPIEAFVNRGPFPADGGRSIVNANSWSWSNPAEVSGHPSMRMIVDMDDFDASLAVLPTGQSGHPQHPHYDDMITLWLNGEFHPLRWDEDGIIETAVDHLILQPSE